MTKRKHSEQAVLELYRLTKQFTYKYQRIYYVQYRGDIEDLVSDYFIDFMRRKSRVEGEEENLLDKFDPSITTLPYLVKVAVKRKLIDSSRSDKAEIRIDPILDEYGDSANTNLNLVHIEDETVDSLEFDEDDIFRAKVQFSLLPKESQTKLRNYYEEVRTVISPNVLNLLSEVLDRNLEATIGKVTCRCCQVTEKSLQFVRNGEILTFNRFNGEQRASERKYFIGCTDLKKFEDIECFKL